MPDAAPETLLLRPTLAKRLVRLASCGLFTVIGVLMVREREAWGWLVLSFFGLGTALFTLLLLPGSEYLRLTAEGFELRSLWRTHRQRWSDIAAFYAGRIARNAMVLIDYAPAYTGQRRARRFATGLAGTEGALPDTYGYSAEALAELLNEWRRRYSSQP